MAGEPVQKAILDRSTKPGLGLATPVDAGIRVQVHELSTRLEQYAHQAYADVLPSDDTPCHEVNARLDEKRKELQEQLNLGDELRHWLQVLQSISPPAPNELCVRVLVLQGSLYDFSRLGKAGNRERLNRALQNAGQLFKTYCKIAISFGQPEIIPKGSGTWELTLDELWKLGQHYASKGTPALLFADRILMPDKSLPHSWGQADQSIACVADAEWLGGGTGNITAHNLAHLLGLDDNPQSNGLLSHDEPKPHLTQEQIERMQKRLAQRTPHWVQEHSAARQQAEDALDSAQRAVVLLERQGDKLWQLYQTCLERSKETPAHGVRALPNMPPPVLSRLAQDVERLSHQVERVEKELATAKEILAEIQTRLREISA